MPDQQLQNLRYCQGYKDSEGLFAYCPDCDKKWTYEQLVNDHVRKTEVVCVPVGSHGMLDNEEQIPKARMMSKIMDYQMSKTSEVPKGCINANYQHHVSYQLVTWEIVLNVKRKAARNVVMCVVHNANVDTECRI